jgi:tetratricopeptide (TPR) repeat protein
MMNTGYHVFLAGKAASSYLNKEYGDAEVFYHRAIDKDSTLWQAAFNLGNVLYRQERYEEAIVYYTKAAAKASPEFGASLLHNLGNAYYKSGHVQESIEAYKQALRKNPLASETRYNLAYIQQQTQQQQKDKAQNGNNQDKKAPPPEKEVKRPEDTGGKRENLTNDQTGQKETSLTEVEIENALQTLDQEERKIHQQLLKKKSRQPPQKSLLNDW